MHRRLVTFAFVLACLIVPSTGFAGGFSVFEAGSKALGTGGAFAARADDPSAIFFNPAGIVDLDGWHASAGVSLIFTATSFAGVDPDPGFGVTEKTKDHVFPPVNAYVTWKFAEKWAAGIGLMNPFGLGQTWENATTFTGRHISQEVDLKTFNFTPVVAFKPIETLRLSVGAQLVHGSVKLHRYQQAFNSSTSSIEDVGTATLEGSNDLDTGWCFGVLLDVASNARVGVNYRSDVQVSIDGDATFVQQSTGDPAFDAVVAAQFPDNQGVSTTVHLPAMWWLAGMYDGVQNWMFMLDLVFYRWSQFQTLGFNFAADPSLDVTRPQNYDDTVQIRMGAEYALNEQVALRLGYYWDPSPQPQASMSPLLADKDRSGVSVGVGYTKGAWTLDAFGLALISPERSTAGASNDQYNGTYGSYGYIAGVNVGYAWGGGDQ